MTARAIPTNRSIVAVVSCERQANAGLQDRRRAAEIPVADAAARQVAQRGGDEGDAHPGGDQADDRLHLDRLLDDPRLPAVPGVVAGDEIMEGRRILPRKQDERGADHGVGDSRSAENNARPSLIQLSGTAAISGSLTSGR